VFAVAARCALPGLLLEPGRSQPAAIQQFRGLCGPWPLPICNGQVMGRRTGFRQGRAELNLAYSLAPAGPGCLNRPSLVLVHVRAGQCPATGGGHWPFCWPSDDQIPAVKKGDASWRMAGPGLAAVLKGDLARSWSNPEALIQYTVQFWVYFKSCCLILYNQLATESLSMAPA